MKGNILVVEDDDTFRAFLETVLQDDGHQVQCAADGEKALRLLKQGSYDLVVSDLKLPGKSGLDLFRETRNDPAAPQFIFLTAYGKVGEAVAAIKEGAVDFLTKPLQDPEVLLRLVRHVIEEQLRERDYLSLKQCEAAGLPPEELIFAGQAMAPVRKLVHDVAGTMANVLVFGESGTGKELVARTIHQLSSRRNAGFVALNCAAIPETLLESELFGHEKGAFTGAVQARQGKFELARGGTILLDEIGEMPLALQTKLLRVIQERVFERVGGTKEIKADVRLVAATNRNLREEVAQRRFREDLYYRLNVFPVQLPPLRERGDAVPVLSRYFMQRFSSQTGKALKGIDADALAALERYRWPGNIRELQNVMERAVILSREKVGLSALPDEMLRTPEPDALDSRERLKSAEREIIAQAIKKHRGNRRLAAEELGVSRRTLQYKLKEYGFLEER
ncbi:sigma-54-dependent transcriptional regulator [Citrifermentans bremense]|uniref:sigma-54-dependent transcriptional regulator n=1 Tax=Citrifermentans bremense TaxID=60035 RepID=UPI000414CFA8|nr:sigma-54 dependent transcriptional regulator [Citrifermentans bremense]